MPTIPIEIDLRPDQQWIESKDRRRGRFVKAHQAHFGPWAGFDRSQAGAKTNLLGAITRFAQEAAPLQFIVYGGTTAVVWCQPHDLDGISWRYRVITDTGYSGTSVVKSQRDAVEGARWHLADAAAMADVFDEEAVEAAATWLDLESNVNFLTMHDGRALRRYCAWQRARRWADQHHQSDPFDPHQWASDHQDEYLEDFERPPADIKETA